MQISPDSSYGTSWKIVDDGGNKVLSINGTMSVFAGRDWADYTLMVRVKLVDAPEGAFICVRVGEEGRDTSSRHVKTRRS
jgi:hypothetical protein